MTNSVSNTEFSTAQQASLFGKLSAALREAVKEINGEKLPKKLAFDIMGNYELRVKFLVEGRSLSNPWTSFYVYGPKEPASDSLSWGPTQFAADHTYLRLQAAGPEDLEILDDEGLVITPESLASTVVAAALASSKR